MNKAILKPGKEKSLNKKHPWIFSGALYFLPKIQPGEILPVYSHSGEFLAQAYFHPDNSLSGRILSFTQDPIEKTLAFKIEQALFFRQYSLQQTDTNAYRLIHGESDGLPGLVVDVYNDVLSLQVNTWGMERLKPLIVSLLVNILKPKAIFEKSLSSARKLDGLEPTQGFLYGNSPNAISILENGIIFKLSLETGQKTGFFLDQREMRKQIQSLSFGKKVLNCFSYSGGFSLYALKGGATHVTSVDSSSEATLLCHKNTHLNGYSETEHTIIEEDVFSFLEQAPSNFDLVILDPPAFAKKRGDVEAACRGYKELNTLAFLKMKTPSLLLTCSCSYFIDPELFQNVVFQAALDAGKEPKIIGSHRQASDHPTSLMHPEGAYLKSLLLYV